MIRYTPEAQAYLDDYLTDVRSAVAGHASVSPDEIEQDIRDHVTAALDASTTPVTATDVAAVLERLGQPSEWVADGERSLWKFLGDKLKPVGHAAAVKLKALPGETYQAGRSIAARFRGLSHDWRLAYLAFGLFALGMIAFPLFPAFLIASYFAARADVSLARRARRSARCAALARLSPARRALGRVVHCIDLLADSGGHRARKLHAPLGTRRRGGHHRRVAAPVEPVVNTYLVVGFVSAWWCIVSLVTLRFPKLPAAMFPPFGSRLRRIDALIVLLLSGTMLVIWLSKFDVACEVTRRVMWQ